MDAHVFLSRIPKHPRAEPVYAAVAEFAKIANDFTAAKASLKSGDRLTARGVNDALNDALPGYAARLAAARKPIDALAAEAKTRRAAMKVKEPDPANLAGAIQQQEIRSWLRSLEPIERARVLTATDDLRILEAALSAPPNLSGIDQGEIADRVEAKYLQIAHAAGLAEVAELERLAAEATAAALTARGELQRTSELDERSFTAKVGPAQSKAALPWCRRDGDRMLVVEIDDSGRASYRPATEWEAKAGVEYANLAEYNAAIGKAAA